MVTNSLVMKLLLRKIAIFEHIFFPHFFFFEIYLFKHIFCKTYVFSFLNTHISTCSFRFFLIVNRRYRHTNQMTQKRFTYNHFTPSLDLIQPTKQKKKKSEQLKKVLEKSNCSFCFCTFKYFTFI